LIGGVEGMSELAVSLYSGALNARSFSLEVMAACAAGVGHVRTEQLGEKKRWNETFVVEGMRVIARGL
jgi:hypothetical protein